MDIRRCIGKYCKLTIKNPIENGGNAVKRSVSEKQSDNGATARNTRIFALCNTGEHSTTETSNQTTSRTFAYWMLLHLRIKKQLLSTSKAGQMRTSAWSLCYWPENQKQAQE